MSNEMILLLVLLVLALGVWPAWPHSNTWGYRPSGILIILLLVFFIWTLADHRPLFRRDMHDVGSDLQQAGRDTADSVRRAVN